MPTEVNAPQELRLNVSPELERHLLGAIPLQPYSTLDFVRSAEDAARAIKPILASGRATFLIISGAQDARRWYEQSGKPNNLLPSVFSDHFHFGLMHVAEAKGLLLSRLSDFSDATVNEAQRELLACWFLVQCRGLTRVLWPPFDTWLAWEKGHFIS